VRLSQSVLSAAGDCQRKAQYTLDRPKWAKRVGYSHSAVGTGFHAGNEILYIARRDGITEPTLDDCIGRGIEIFDTSMTTDLYDNTPIQEFKWSDDVPDQATAHDLIAQMLTAYWPDHWPADWTVLAVEIHGNITDPYIGWDCKVGADLVLLDPNDWVWGIDFKTSHKSWNKGKEHPRKNVQSPFYNRLLKQIFDGHAGYRFVFDIMKYPNTKSGPVLDRRVSDPQPEHEEAVKVMARQFITVYEKVHVELGEDLPANPQSNLCSEKYCDFWNGCPHGAALDN
jgi:hypothetical protein